MLLLTVTFPCQCLVDFIFLLQRLLRDYVCISSNWKFGAPAFLRIFRNHLHLLHIIRCTRWEQISCGFFLSFLSLFILYYHQILFAILGFLIDSHRLMERYRPFRLCICKKEKINITQSWCLWWFLYKNYYFFFYFNIFFVMTSSRLWMMIFEIASLFTAGWNRAVKINFCFIIEFVWPKNWIEF